MDIKDFLNVLASKEPVPGGGGACGYVAAVGMALGNMVLSLTTGKKKYAEYQEEIEELIVKAGDITNRLYECMDKDAKAFKPLSEAYGLPKGTEEQLEHRNKVMENALLIASEAPSTGSVPDPNSSTRIKEFSVELFTISTMFFI